MPTFESFLAKVVYSVLKKLLIKAHTSHAHVKLKTNSNFFALTLKFSFQD